MRRAHSTITIIVKASEQYLVYRYIVSRNLNIYFGTAREKSISQHAGPVRIIIFRIFHSACSPFRGENKLRLCVSVARTHVL